MASFGMSFAITQSRRGATSRNVTGEVRFAMLQIDEPEVLDGEVLGDEVACTDLVPLNPAAAHWAPKRSLNRPDPSFITQLIATAEQVPQTRSLRRGSYADAQSAYGQHISERRSVSRRTRQII